MPSGDRTGPIGFGPMTGRAAGYCAGYPVPGFMNPITGPAFSGRGYVPYRAPYGMAPYGLPAYPAAPYGGLYAPAYAGFPNFGFGFGRGRGWGHGWGRGRGRSFGRAWGWGRAARWAFGPVW